SKTEVSGPRPPALATLGDALSLPFASHSFDLIFCQNVLLWTGPGAVAEAARVLQPGGALVCIEPDFGGMLEWPDEIALRDVWLRGLTAAGADPEIGRKLPGACESAGLDSWVELQNLPQPTTADAVRLCEGLPLSEADSARVDAAAAALADLLGAWSAFVHVPYVLVVAMKPW
ncbi:MAG TPA: methyltransferase domain-containing protein, partial [Armatimonadota bacterium]|nr:methyltransferase domain-containing protein [Armatimonadota bacterium]